MELSVDVYWTPNNDNDHMAFLLENSNHSIAELEEFLEKIDRFDVLDDCRSLFCTFAVSNFRYVLLEIMVLFKLLLS